MPPNPEPALCLIVLPAPLGRPATNPCDLPPSLSRVAELVAAGHGDADIALALGLTRRTVETYVGRIFQRLGVRSRAAVAHAHHAQRARRAVLDGSQ